MSQYLDERQRERAPIRLWADGFVVCDAITAAEAEPAYIIPTGDTNNLLTHISYTGTVSAADVRLWYMAANVWYRATTTNSGVPLTGKNETRLWEVSQDALVGFTVESVSGGGAVTIRAEAVE